MVGAASNRGYIVFGRDGGFDGDIDLTALADDEGIAITLYSARYSFIAGSVGNVNGDGFDDVVINDLATSFLLFGFATTAGTQQVGDATAQALTGGDGADTLYGIDGADTLVGGLGRDSLFGNAGDDNLDGGIGDDSLKGQIGDDTAAGGIGNDLLFGGGGNDAIDADIGDDVVNGNSGADNLAGGRGADTLRGQGGPDTLIGGLGNDILLGMAGVDRLDGGGGNDTLIGGMADDVLTGGDGRDIFVFAAGQGSDAVIDFADGVDRIALPGVAGFGDLVNADTDLGTRITLVAGGAGLTITLAGFDADQLSAADFLFGG